MRTTNNNRYVDEQLNSWSCDEETEVSASIKSRTLTNCNQCSDCIGCSDCNGCSGCRDCNGCRDCIGCNDCSDCSGCNSCNDCRDCNYCRGCNQCNDCGGCSDCNHCIGCNHCNGCKDFKRNPQTYRTKKIGSINAQAFFYWTNTNDIQVVCGCWKSNLHDFQQRVEEAHKGLYLDQYLKEIEILKSIINRK